LYEKSTIATSRPVTSGGGFPAFGERQRKPAPGDTERFVSMLQRRKLRRTDHEQKHAQYHKSGLNGPRAVARRLRKMGVES
jgi:hypothetical protein